MSETCATCRFFVQRRDDGAGSCHRFPPVTVLDPAGNYSVYCDSHAEHWCGEHRPAEQPERDAYTRAGMAVAEADARYRLAAIESPDDLVPGAIDDDLETAGLAFLRLYREKHGG